MRNQIATADLTIMRILAQFQALVNVSMDLLTQITVLLHWIVSHDSRTVKLAALWVTWDALAAKRRTLLLRIQGSACETYHFMIQMVDLLYLAKADFKIEQHVKTMRNPTAIHEHIRTRQSTLRWELVNELLVTMITPRARLHWTDSSVPMNVQHVMLAQMRHEQAVQMLTLFLQVVPVSECVPRDFST